MNDRLAKAEALFHDALELPPERRESFVQTACGEDAELLREVTALLRASGIADEWLKDADCAAADPREGERSRKPEIPGTVIGRYKLLEKIGEGGFGVVYMAEQQEPVHRKVALKIIKLGMDTKSVIARFEAERQALALMDHPNIAKVLDAGATETGRPYFVMELVRGVPITKFCEENQLGLHQRLDLFIQVCSAIQHAHQKGIIHRDIKPTNVLVTLNDGVPHPMVIDFGVAKALNQRLTERTLFTNFAQMIGTPAYMSPEQAEMSKLDVDTRSDVYSLGVLLYELLTGTTPFPEERLRSAGYAEMQRIIAEEEPEPPSTRFKRRSAMASPAQSPIVDRKSKIENDLDWIVMRCLEKDRTRRYETASALALDIQRHLKNETVLARPPSNLYRFQKLVRRNRLAFAAAGAVTMALVLGLVASTWLFLRERQARRLTKEAEHKAQAEATKREEIATFVQQLRRLLGGDDLEMAQSLVNVAVALHKKGKLSEAEEALSHALTIQSKENAELDTARALECLGLVLQDQRKLDDAEKAFRQSLALRKKVLGKVHPTVIDALNALAVLMITWNRHSEAVPFLEEAADGNSVDAQLMLARLYANGRGVQKDDAESVKWLRKAAAQSSSLAEYQLGRKFASGQGVELDLVEAARWIHKSAEQGRLAAIFSLARMYATGRGVPKDPEEADRWMRKANEAVERWVEDNDLYRLNMFARERAADGHSDVRDGTKAVEVAERVVHLSGRKIAAYLDTLAAAHAEAGDFQQAVAVQREAISLAKDNPKVQEGFILRLRLYETNTPYRSESDVGMVVFPR